jgi:hypothetical protein
VCSALRVLSDLLISLQDAPVVVLKLLNLVLHMDFRDLINNQAVIVVSEFSRQIPIAHHPQIDQQPMEVMKEKT